jgi:hypothetical protein
MARCSWPTGKSFRSRRASYPLFIAVVWFAAASGNRVGLSIDVDAAARSHISHLKISSKALATARIVRNDPRRRA